GGGEEARAGWPATPRRPRRAGEARPSLRRDGGAALRRAARALGAAEGRRAGRGVVDHQAVLQRVRETLLRAVPRDSRPLRAGDRRRTGRNDARRRLVVGCSIELGLRVPVGPRRHDLFGFVRDPEERHRRAGARATEGNPRRPREELRRRAWIFLSAPTSSCFAIQHARSSTSTASPRTCGPSGTTRAATVTPCGRRWRSSAGSALRCPKRSAAARLVWSRPRFSRRSWAAPRV